MRAAGRPDEPGAVPYDPIAMMTGLDVTMVLERLDGAGIEAWLDGGWAVDALLGEQTRAHEDLDLIVRVRDVPAMREALAGDDFELDLRDKLDMKVAVFEAGDGIYRMENGRDWVFPADGFSGRGRIEARDVRCLTADVQMLCHATGYTPGETDIHDMRLLNARLGTVLLPPFDEL